MAFKQLTGQWIGRISAGPHPRCARPAWIIAGRAGRIPGA